MLDYLLRRIQLLCEKARIVPISADSAEFHGTK